MCIICICVGVCVYNVYVYVAVGGAQIVYASPIIYSSIFIAKSSPWPLVFIPNTNLHTPQLCSSVCRCVCVTVYVFLDFVEVYFLLYKFLFTWEKFSEAEKHVHTLFFPSVEIPSPSSSSSLQVSFGWLDPLPFRQRPSLGVVHLLATPLPLSQSPLVLCLVAL